MDYTENKFHIFKNNGVSNDEVQYSFFASFSSPGNCHKMDALDVDQDGDLDFILTVYPAGAVHLAINGDNNGNGDGSAWTTVLLSSTGGNSAEIADVNLDGYPDIILADTTNLYYLENSFTYRETTQYFVRHNLLTGVSPYSVALLDFDRNGVTDVAFTRYNSNNARLYKGVISDRNILGRRTFSLDPSYTSHGGVSHYHIAAGNFNGDNIPDLAMGVYNSETVYIAELTSNGFTGANVYSIDNALPLNDVTGDLFAFDVDGDGIDELMGCQHDSKDKFVDVKNQVSYGIGKDPYTSAYACNIGDLDNDGDIDMLLGAYTNSEGPYFYRNDIGTAPGNPSPITHPSLPNANLWVESESLDSTHPLLDGTRDVLEMDVNGDGQLDLVFADSNSNLLRIYEYTAGVDAEGHRSYIPLASISAGATLWKAYPIDIDADGDLDIMYLSSSKTVHIARNGDDSGNGDGTTWTVRQVHSAVFDCDVGDINLDGYDDIVCGTGSDIIWLENRYQRTDRSDAWESGTRNADFLLRVLDSANMYGIKLFDYDGDGVLDVAATQYTAGNNVFIFRNNLAAANVLGRRIPQLSLKMSESIGAEGSFINAGFVNADSTPDLIVNDYEDGQVHVLFLSVVGEEVTATVVSTPTSSSTVTVSHGRIHLADVDSDGDMDIVSCRGSSSGVWIIENLGSNTFADGVSVRNEDIASTAYTTTYSCSVIDMDGDGVLDIVVPQDTAPLTVYFNERTTPASAPPALYTLGTQTAATFVVDDDLETNDPRLAGSMHMEFVDFVGDSNLDMVAFDYTEDKYHFYRGTGKGVDGKPDFVFLYSVIASGGNPWRGSFHDVDNDGDLDFFAHSYSRDLAVYRNGDSAGSEGVFSATNRIEFGTVYDYDVGDVNGDGWLDVVAASSLAIYFFENMQPRVSDSNENDDFHRHSIVSPDDYRSVTLLDYDNDGDLDFAASRNSRTLLHIYENDLAAPDMMGRRLSTWTRISTINQINDDGLYIKSAYMDGDDVPDLVMVYEDRAKMAVFLLNADASLKNAYQFDTIPVGAANLYQGNLILADLDSDGDMDIGYCRYDVGMVVHENLFDEGGTIGDVVYPYYVSDTNHNHNTYSCNMQDIDGDGDIDIIVSGYVSPTYILRNENTNPAPAPKTYTLDAPTNSLFTQSPRMQDLHSEIAGSCDFHFADVTGDGIQDMVVCDYQSTHVHVFTGTGTLDAFGYPEFSAKKTFSSNAAPTRCYLVDMDNDGDLDIVVQETTHISLLFNGDHDGVEGTVAGDGSNFNHYPHVLITGTGSSKNCDIGDFNLDGYNDLVCADGSDVYFIENVMMYYDTSDNFAAQERLFRNHPLVTGINARDVTLLDFNNDGVLDLAVGRYTQHSVYIYRNDLSVPDIFGRRTPSMVRTDTITVNTETQRITSGFMDTDNVPDVVVSHYNDGEVTVILLTSSGVEKSRDVVTFPFGSASSFANIVLADLDSDGRPEVISCTGTDGMVVIQNKYGSGGTLSAAMLPYYAPESSTAANGDKATYPSYSCGAADVDGDGDMDIILPGYTSTALFFINHIDVTAPTPQTYVLGSQSSIKIVTSNIIGARNYVVGGVSIFAHSMQQFAADVTGDQKSDLIVCSYSQQKIYIMRNTGEVDEHYLPLYESHYTISTSMNNHRTWVEDIDGDGDNDIVSHGYLNGRLNVFLNNGDGTFSADVVPNSESMTGVDVADIDMDGDLDIVYVTGNQLKYYEQTSPGVFTAIDPSLTFSRAETVGVITDSAGIPHLAFGRGTGDYVWFVKNTPQPLADGKRLPSFTNSYETRSPYSPTHSVSVRADFNKDGVMDFAIASVNQDEIAVFLMDDGANVKSGMPITIDGVMTTTFGQSHMFAEDLNNDGYPDIVIATVTNGVRVIQNLRNGNFAAPVSPRETYAGVTTGSLYSIGFGDIDDDGDIDILAGEYSSSTDVNGRYFYINEAFSTRDFYLQPIYRASNGIECAHGTHGPDCACTTYDDNGVITDAPVELDNTATRVESGDLYISYTEPTQFRYMNKEHPDVVFFDNNGNEDPDAATKCSNLFTWSVTEPADACGVRVWVGRAPVISAVSGSDGCLFESLVSSDSQKDIARFRIGVTDYEWVNAQEGDNDNESGSDSGTYILREVTHMLSFDLEFPRSIAVSTSVDVYSEVVTARALTLSSIVLLRPVTNDEPVLTVRMFTSVQHPFALVYTNGAVSTPDDAKFTVRTSGLSMVEEECLDIDNTDCDRVFEWEIVAVPTQCDFDGAFSITFDVVCNPNYSNECPLAGTETVVISYNVDSDSHCATVVDSVEIQATLTSYKTDASYEVSNEEDEFIQDDIMYFQASIGSVDVSLASVAVNSLSVGSVEIINNGLEDSTKMSDYAVGYAGDSGVTTPGDTSTNLLPTTNIKTRADLLGVNTRSTQSFTVTIVYDVVYSTSFTPSSDPRRSHVMIPAGNNKKSHPVSSRRSVLSYKNEQAVGTTEVKIGLTDDSSVSSSDTGIDFDNTANLTFFTVGAAALALVLFAITRVRRSSTTTHDELTEVTTNEPTSA